MNKVSGYLWLIVRLVFATYYFCVGVLGFILNNQAKDAANAATDLERVMAQSGFLNPLLCLCCTLGGGSLFMSRTTPLGLVILSPLVIIIFFFHVVITKHYGWGALNLTLLLALVWRFRWGFKPLWNYARSSET